MVQKDLIDYFILEIKQKQKMQSLYKGNVKNMDTYFKPSTHIEETNMTIGFTTPFYNTMADRLAHHKNNTNE